jgi:polyhydroxyalkanoate synthesis regulator phasin
MPKKQSTGEKLIESEKEAERRRFLAATRRVMLASVGAVGLAQDELENFVKRLVKRGEIADKDARNLLKEVNAKRPKRAQRGLSKQMDKLRPPSKADIELLREQISELSDKVNQLLKEMAHA